MQRYKGIRSVVVFTQTGCLLPLLILFNLFFGWMFFNLIIWLSISGILILLFMLNAYILARRTSALFSKRDNVIDVKGEVVEDRHKLK